MTCTAFEFEIFHLSQSFHQIRNSGAGKELGADLESDRRVPLLLTRSDEDGEIAKRCTLYMGEAIAIPGTRTV